MAHYARQQPVVMTPVPDLVLSARNSSLFFVLPKCVQLSEPTVSNIKHELGVFFLFFLLLFLDLIILFVFFCSTIFLFLYILNRNFFNIIIFLFVFDFSRFILDLFFLRLFLLSLLCLFPLLRGRAGPGTADRGGGRSASSWGIRRGAGDRLVSFTLLTFHLFLLNNEVRHAVLAIDPLKLLHLLPDQAHHPNPGKNMLPAETLPGNTVSKCFTILIAGLTEMPHEQAGVGLETLLTFPPEVPDQPLAVEDILRRHAVPHDSIEEALTLPGIEAQHLDITTNSGQEWRKRSVFLPLHVSSYVTPTSSSRIVIVILLIKVIILLIIITWNREIRVVIRDILLPRPIPIPSHPHLPTVTIINLLPHPLTLPHAPGNILLSLLVMMSQQFLPVCRVSVISILLQNFHFFLSFPSFFSSISGNLETAKIFVSPVLLFFNTCLTSVKERCYSIVIINNIIWRLPVFIEFSLLEKLFSTKLENIIDLLLRKISFAPHWSTLHNQMSQHHFLLGHLCDPLLHGVPGDESVYHDLILLPDPVGSAEGLDIIVRIPVTVIDDNGVGSGQIDSETSSPGGEQEHKLLSTWLVEPINGLLPHCTSDASINPLILVPNTVEEILEKIQHFCHLGEDQNSVTFCLQLLQHFSE